MYSRFNRGFGNFSNIGLLLLRWGVGGSFFLIHGLPKIEAGPETWAKLGHAMGNLGIYFYPEFWGFLAAGAECFGGICLIMGFLTRPAAFFLAFDMLVAVLLHQANHNSWETTSHALELGSVFLGLLFIGPGKFSVDAQLGAD